MVVDVFCLFVPCVSGGEAVDKFSASRSGSAVKSEEGMGTTEEDAVAEETGQQQPDGLCQTKEALLFFAA